VPVPRKNRGALSAASIPIRVDHRHHPARIDAEVVKDFAAANSALIEILNVISAVVGRASKAVRIGDEGGARRHGVGRHDDQNPRLLFARKEPARAHISGVGSIVAQKNRGGPDARFLCRPAQKHRRKRATDRRRIRASSDTDDAPPPRDEPAPGARSAPSASGAKTNSSLLWETRRALRRAWRCSPSSGQAFCAPLFCAPSFWRWPVATRPPPETEAETGFS